MTLTRLVPSFHEFDFGCIRGAAAAAVGVVPRSPRAADEAPPRPPRRSPEPALAWEAGLALGGVKDSRRKQKSNAWSLEVLFFLRVALQRSCGV